MKLTKAPAIMILITLLSASLAGCIGNEDKSSSSDCEGDDLKVAYDLKDDLEPESIDNPTRIADYLCDVLEMNVTIYDVDSPELACLLYTSDAADE